MKRLFTILCAATLTLSVSAQVQFGAVTGLNIASIAQSDGSTDDGVNPDESRLGLHFGGVAHIPLGDAMQLRTGLIYSQKGAGASEVDGGYPTSFNVKLDYLEIPIEVAFVMGDAFALSAGPYIAFSTNKSVAIETTDPDAAEMIAFGEAIYTGVLDESVSGIDFGLNFGASFIIAEHFLIGTKYSLGLTDIFDVPTTSIAYDPDYSDEAWVNGCFSISFAYMFGG